PASRTPHPATIPPVLYNRDLLLTFSGEEYADFLAGGGRQLRPRLARSLELARLGPDMHVLDIGCGRGEITLHAARRGATVTAIDFSTDCLELTSRTLALASPAERARVRLVRADATALPVNDSSIHRALFLDVAEHLQPWQLRLALEEIRRILRPDGYAVIHTLPNRWALDIGYQLMRRLFPDLPADPRSDYERQVHVNELDLLGLSGVLDEAGLHSRVWLENWTAAHARWGAGRQFTDPLRDQSYPLLGRRCVGRFLDALMRTPLRLVLANDIFAIAWPPGRRSPAPVWPHGWWERLALTLTDLDFSGIMYEHGF
ncbi:MAG: methyltransferase domain-containing protein, partial [Anaerolineae bacterium]